jgi:phosphatidylserine decarboxylase
VVAREGIPHISIPFVLTVVLFILGFQAGGAAAGVVTVAVALFFRDPERVHSAEAGDILSPADGRIVTVDRVEENRHLGEEALQRAREQNTHGLQGGHGETRSRRFCHGAS